ncbi:MAG: class I SAM-dependent methyltransferase, partial [Parvularculaceae bacterium]
LEAARACGVAACEPELRRCCACGSVAMSPLPQDEELSAFYQHYHAAESFIAKANKKIARAQRRLAPLKFAVKGRQFLDVGASIGTAAEAARRLGFEATALELDRAAIEQGQAMFPGVDFIAGTMADLPAGAAFDIIYMAEIIEHVTEPSLLAQQAFERLRPGGLVFLTTPDAGHFRRPKNFLDWKSVKPPEHVTLFTKKGLRALFAAAGFDPIIFMPHLKPGVRMIARAKKR